MASATLKLENGLCRCCHAEGTFKSLDSAVMSQEQEIFSNILRECFDVTIIPVDGDLSAVTYTICETCSNRLFEASTFKKQVLSCEERFRDLYSDHVFKTLESLEADVKVELPESFNQDLKEEFSRDDSALDEDDIFTYPDGDGDDDDDKKDLCFELNVDTSEKKRKAKSKRKIKSKEPKVKKSKRGRPKKKLESDTKHDGETTSEQSKSTKKGVPPGPVLHNEDYVITEAKTFVCKKCGEVHNNYGDLQLHCIRHANDSPSFKYRNWMYITEKDGTFFCKICGNKKKSRESIVSHLRTHKEKKCDACDFTHTSSYKVKLHMNETHGVPIPTCEICGKKTQTEASLSYHRRSVHMRDRKLSYRIEEKKTLCVRLISEVVPEEFSVIEGLEGKKYICRKCGEEQDTIEQTQIHFLSHQNDLKYAKNKNLQYITEREGAFACKICGIEKVTKTDILTHLKIHKESKCTLCDFKIKSRLKYKKHMEEMHGILAPTCGICGKKTISQGMLSAHQRAVHMQEKNVSCNMCDLKFFNNAKLKRHMVKHTGEKKYICEYCNKAFPRRTALQFHIRIHVGDKRKVCGECGQAFVQKASLNYHMLKYHPQNV